MFRTLASTTKEEISRIRRSNLQFIPYNYGFWRKKIQKIKDYPILSIVITIVFMAFLMYILRNHALSFFRGSFIDNNDLKAILSSLLSAQASLAGIVYPVVIGLVSLFIGRADDRAIQLEVFYNETETIFAGGITITFLVLIGVVLLLSPNLPPGPSFIASIFFVFWFFINMSSLSFFLWRTFLFLRPNHRNELLKSYISNHLLISELKRLLAYNHFVNAVECGYLPIGYQNNNLNFSISTFPYFQDEGRPQVVVHFKKPKQLHNIRFYNVVLAFYIWMYRQRVKQKINKKTYKEVLRFPILPYMIHAPTAAQTAPVILSSIEGETDLNFVERTLVRSAFRFRDCAPSVDIETETEEALSELARQVGVYMASKNESAIRDTLANLRDCHVFLMRLCEVPDANENELSNLAELEDFTYVFGRKLSQKWLRPYHSIFSNLSSYISEYPQAFSRACRLPGELLSQTSDLSSIRIRQELIDLHAILTFRYLDWIVSTSARSQGSGGNAAVRLRVSGYEAEARQRVLRSIGTSYDDSVRAIFIGMRKKVSWSDAGLIKPLIIRLIGLKTSMVAASVMKGDDVCSSWILDALLRWSHHVDFYVGERTWLVPEQVKLNGHIALLGRETSDLNWIGDGGSLPFPDDPENLVGALIKTYWQDACLILAVSLSYQINESQCTVESPVSSAIARILEGEFVDHDSAAEDAEAPISRPQDIITGFVRGIFLDRIGRGEYGRILERLVEDIFQQTELPKTSERVYTGYGVGRITDLRKGFAVVLVVKCIKTATYRGYERLRTVGLKTLAEHEGSVDELKALASAVLEIEKPMVASILERIGVAELSEDQFKARLEDISKGVRELADQIDSIRQERIVSEDVSRNKLLQIGVKASQKGFDTEIGFPLNLFQQIEFASEDMEKYTIRFSEFPKAQLIEPSLESPPVNEGEFFANVVKERIATVVLGDVLKRVSFKEIYVKDAYEWWEHVKEAANPILARQERPMLLARNGVSPRWINEWIWRSPSGREEVVPQDLKVLRPSDDDEGVVAYFNGIGIVACPISKGENIIVSEKVFKKIRFRAYDSDRYLEVSFKTDEAGVTGTLSLTFEREVQVEDLGATRVMYNSGS